MIFSFFSGARDLGSTMNNLSASIPDLTRVSLTLWARWEARERRSPPLDNGMGQHQLLHFRVRKILGHPDDILGLGKFLLFVGVLQIFVVFAGFDLYFIHGAGDLPLFDSVFQFLRLDFSLEEHKGNTSSEELI